MKLYVDIIQLSHRQDEETSADVRGKVYRPTKKSLKEKYLKDCSKRDCITEFTIQRPKYLEDYHNMLPLYYQDKAMTDDELDALIYN